MYVCVYLKIIKNCNQGWMLNFSKLYLGIYGDDENKFFLSLLTWLIMSIHFLILNYACIPNTNSIYMWLILGLLRSF